MTIEPIATHCMGKSVCSIWLPLSPRKVLTIKFHFSASDVSPPATIKPVAGHMTQRNVIGNVCSEIIPCESRNGGGMNQLTAVPMAIAKQIRTKRQQTEVETYVHRLHAGKKPSVPDPRKFSGDKHQRAGCKGAKPERL